MLAPPQGRVVVLGGAVLDVVSRGDPSRPLLMATSNPGTVTLQVGGVGRNIAEAMTRLKLDALLVTPVGADLAAETLKQQCKTAGMDVSGFVPCNGQRTAVYSALMQADGELLYGVIDSTIFNSFTFQAVLRYQKQITEASWLVLDANNSVEFMVDVCNLCARQSLPVLFEPVSVQKARKIARPEILKRIAVLCPNVRELIAIFHGLNHHDASQLDSYLAEALNFGTAEYQRMIAAIFAAGVQQAVVVKMGALGVLAGTKASDGAIAFRTWPAVPAKVVNVLGAGDCFVAGLMYGLLRKLSTEEAVPYGLVAAKLSVESQYTVPPELKPELLEAGLHAPS